MGITNIEFYTYNNDLWYIKDGKNTILTEEDTDIICGIIELIHSNYPDAYTALTECYKNSASNVPYYHYLIVRRFCKCNFGNLDNAKYDIDHIHGFNFEAVQCPLRGECKYQGRICCPKFETRLSSAEKRVAELFAQGCTYDEIADRLFLSPHTVKVHVRSILRKTNTEDKASFILYCSKNNLFNG